MKLSIAQSTMLRVIAQSSLDREGKEKLPWYPRTEATVETRKLSFSASCAGPALKALIRKGLIQPYPRLGEYSAIITELGLSVAEQEKGKPLTFISCFDQQILLAKRLAGED